MREVENEHGQIKDPEIARDMADVEAPYRKKILGIFSPSEEKIKKGEKEAEWHLGNILHKNFKEQEPAMIEADINTMLGHLEEYKEHFHKFPSYIQQRWTEVEEYAKDKSLDRKMVRLVIEITLRDVARIWHESKGFRESK